MILRLKVVSLEPVFGRLCQDLVDNANGVTDELALINLCLSRLELWKRLFRRLADGFLPEHEIKGLVGELLVLESLCLSGNRALLEVVEGWRGPLDGDQDFLFGDTAIEVKTVGPGSPEVSISSLRQLEAIVPIRLRVLELRMSDASHGDNVSLNSLAARLEALLSRQSSALSLFRERLVAAGYVEDLHYDRFWFSPLSCRTYIVGELFPRLIATTVPDGVVGAIYKISLQAIAPHLEDGVPVNG